MPWNVTLEISRCDAPTTFLANVFISSGTVALGQSDANGRFIVVVLDDAIEFVILTMRKTGTVCFLDKNLTITKSVDNGKTIKTCLTEVPCEPVTGTGPSCFIVTAATGSAESMEVQGLRQLRDRVGASSRLVARLIEAIYTEYAQFSPPIAEELRQDPLTREAVLRVVVRPLFAWYTLAGKLALDHADGDEADRAARDVMDACAPYAGDTNIVALLEAIRHGGRLPPAAPRVLRDVAPLIARLPVATWAILDPLARVWRAAADGRALIDEVAEWLGDAPVETLSPIGDAASLDAELAVLADYFAFRPAMRGRLGERLVAAWPGTAGTLGHRGFLAEAPLLEKEQ